MRAPPPTLYHKFELGLAEVPFERASEFIATFAFENRNNLTQQQMDQLGMMGSKLRYAELMLEGGRSWEEISGILSCNTRDEFRQEASKYLDEFAVSGLMQFMDNVSSGVGGAQAVSSPIEQQALMMETFLQALTSFGLEMSEEELELKKELEEYAEERDRLVSEFEEAKTKFAKELNKIGDDDGLKFIAQALEGNANPESAEWGSFWTRERALAFRRALEE